MLSILRLTIINVELDHRHLKYRSKLDSVTRMNCLESYSRSSLTNIKGQARHWHIYPTSSSSSLSLWCSSSAWDSWSKGRWFDSRPGHYQVN